ncbi:hypothetical protein E2C01_059361 [Portunus trituberculatus]|uniref:Uncharacterized protein n=1 Tax=Portunus trituberculatus TaxID=210409 RepID=A0A5B7H5V5_PORTR|nr:hypothetical protein [Portunus trituberculatus]
MVVVVVLVEQLGFRKTALIESKFPEFPPLTKLPNSVKSASAGGVPRTPWGGGGVVLAVPWARLSRLEIDWLISLQVETYKATLGGDKYQHTSTAIYPHLSRHGARKGVE